MLYNKLDAYQFMAMQLKDPTQVTRNESIATLATLALVEANFWERPGGTSADHVTHLQGLQGVIGLGNRPASQADQSLFQKTLRM